MLPRRRFLFSSLALAAFESLPTKLLRSAAPIFKALPAWKPGVLEIHQIATNRGNSTLLILPDGTTTMVDAGAIYGATPYLSDPLPSSQHRPGEWIGRYAKRRFDASGLTTIDTFLLTHLHGDHVGYLPPDGPLSSDGTYQLTGVSDVAAIVPIHRFVDRAWPDYTYPVPANIDFQKNYRAFLQAQIKTGKKVERFHPGSKDQFALQHKPADYPSFEIRNLIANGEVWTGKGEQTRELFQTSRLSSLPTTLQKIPAPAPFVSTMESSATTPAAISPVTPTTAAILGAIQNLPPPKFAAPSVSLSRTTMATSMLTATGMFAHCSRRSL